MKTLTQFSSLELLEAYRLRGEMIAKLKEQKASTQNTQAPQHPTQNQADQTNSETLNNEQITLAMAPSTQSKENLSEAITPTETLDTHQALPLDSEPSSQSTLEQNTPVDQSTAQAVNQAQPEVKKLSRKERIKLAIERKKAMFEKRRLDIEHKRKEWLMLYEEIKDAFCQTLKTKHSLNDEKIPLFLNALKVIDRKRFRELRRVTVFKLEKEGEKTPKDAIKLDDHFYSPTYIFLPSLHRERNTSRDKEKRFHNKRKPRNKKRFFNSKLNSSKTTPNAQGV